MKTDLIKAVNHPEAGVFHFIDSGEYEIGIDFEAAGNIIPEEGDASEKRNYVLNSAPRHTVQLSGGCISLFFVSFKDFKFFVEETGYLTDAEREGWGWIAERGLWIKRPGLSWRKPFGDAGDEMYRESSGSIPVLQTSWNDASACCAWLTGKTGKEVRLPREAEWEIFALAGGCASITETVKHDDAVELIDGLEYAEALAERAGEDGVLPTGVLREWCEDWFSGYPGSLPNKEYGTVYKVLRGGSLQSHPLQRRREYRFRRCPTARSPYYGFRLFIVAQ
jgi:formylglycine-generating enzyme required for sulfatase activity